jgi:TRAP-type C4-dicarboxylate transport system permease small subunit
MKKKGFWHYVDKGLAFWCVLIMGLMCAGVIVSVFLRYVFNITYDWYEEMIVFLFITTTYFGAILCVHEDEHIDMGLLKEKLPGKAGDVLKIVVAAINLTVQVILAIISFTWIKKTGSSLTPGIRIPWGYIYVMFPICFFSMAIYEARIIIRIILGMLAGELKEK